MCPAHVSGELRYRNRSVASKLGVTTLRVCCHIFLIFPTIDRSTLPRVLLCWFRDLVTLCKKLSSAQIRKRWGHPLMWQLLWCTPCKAAKLQHWAMGSAAELAPAWLKCGFFQELSASNQRHTFVSVIIHVSEIFNKKCRKWCPRKDISFSV